MHYPSPLEVVSLVVAVVYLAGSAKRCIALIRGNTSANAVATTV